MSASRPKINGHRMTQAKYRECSRIVKSVDKRAEMRAGWLALNFTGRACDGECDGCGAERRLFEHAQMHRVGYLCGRCRPAR